MAHGYVTVKPGTPGQWQHFGGPWSWSSTAVFICGEPRVISARVESQGIVVWADGGFPDIAAACDAARTVAHAFHVTGRLGQHHIPWSQVVDEAEEIS